MTPARNLADALVLHAGRRVAAPWGEAMRGEIECIDNDVAALGWAVGCVVASYKERIASMRTSTFSPLLGVAGLMLFAFGGYYMSGGHLAVILEALPHEAMTIVLGALAATTILTTAGGPGIFASLGRALRGRKFSRGDYANLATALSQALSSGGISAALDPAATRMIADALGLLEQRVAPEPMAAILQGRIDGLLRSERRAVRVLNMLTQSLLWFGAIAVMLGVEKTLGYLESALRVLGGMFASASTGFIVGTVAAVGIVLPLARRLDAAIADDAHFFSVIKTAFVCRAAGADVALAVRTSVGEVPDDLQPRAEDSAAPLRPLVSGA